MSATPINPSSSTVDKSESRTARIEARHAAAVKTSYFLLTIPGFTRLLEMFFSSIHIGCYAYHGTYYDRVVQGMLLPLFAAPTRETFFLLVNYNTFVTTFCIIGASLVGVRSRKALAGSMYLFVYDFIQFLLVTSAAVGLVLLYQENDAKKVYGESLSTHQGLTITGFLLGFLHLIGSIYDLLSYARKVESEIVVP